jgi:hypothetical protein
VQEAGSELVIYDQDRARAHRLNPSAALVWRRCDGQTTVAEMAEALAEELGVPNDETVVWLALDRLEQARLLDGGAEGSPRLSRRQVGRQLRHAGLVALLLPVVTSMAAPQPAHAVSDLVANRCRDNRNSSCITATECTNINGSNLGKLDCTGSNICCRITSF